MSDETTEVSDLDNAQAAIDEARRRVAEVPPEVVITNHAMGLYELAAIHLSGDPPNLPAARLAIDAVHALIEGVGERLGDDAETLRAAVANIQMAFVSVSKARPGDDDGIDEQDERDERDEQGERPDEEPPGHTA